MPDPATPEVAAIVLAYVADSAPVLSFRLDSELRVCDANHYARQIVGYAVEGRDFTGLLPDFIARPDIRQLATTPEMVRLITLSTVSGMLESFGFRFFALGDGSVLALGSPDWAEHTRIQSAALELKKPLSRGKGGGAHV